MMNSTDPESSGTGGGEQSHLLSQHESVSGSKSEARKRLPKRIPTEPEQPNPNISPSSEENQPSKRTLQNRKAQREFRDRKASYVKSLEQRIRAYESNEVQSNVELQRAARRLKEENDQLREQVRQLSERLSILEGGETEAAATPTARTPGRSRGSSIHQQPKSQPTPQTLYNQPPTFSNDFAAYNVISPAPSFQTSANPQGYPQYFAQHYTSYLQHQPVVYGQEQPSDSSLNPNLRQLPGRGDNAPGRPPSTQ